MADMPTVDVNTDNLDDFEALLSGKAEVAQEVTPDDDSVETVKEAEEVEVEPTGEDETDEPEAEDVPETDEPQPKKKPSAQERINELTAEKYAEKRRAEEAIKAAYDLERRLAALEAKGKEAPKQETATNVAPDPDDVDDKGNLKFPLGEFDPLYVSALADYRFEQKMSAFEQRHAEEAAKAQQEKAQQEAAAAWQTKLQKSSEGIEDLIPTIQILDTEFGDLEPQFGTQLANTIMSMDYGPEVLYYLAHNIDEARKVVAAGPIGSTLALGKIEARIESALNKKATQPVRTQAPTPPVTTRGNSGRLSIAPDTDDLDAFESLLYNRK